MFTLHPQLNVETYEITSWDLCQVRLMNDRNYPWLVLVPQVPNIKELFDLKKADRERLMDETTHAASLLAGMTQADKINVATLGNMVPQMHVHVIARYESDLAWPRPVWGVFPADPYGEDELKEALTYMKGHFRAP